MTKELSIWNNEKTVQIKKLFAKDLNDSEFEIFMWIWKATGLNPFLREIWAVKYWTQPASIFIGRDWYRKSAQKNPEYDFHIVDAVYSNDNFEIIDWEIKHSYNLKNRGVLVGAYCTVKRKSATKPIFTFVEFKEYVRKWKNWKLTVWDEKPATMIKKVAEAQWLRQAFQELFAGTYDESEEWEKNEKITQEQNFKEIWEKILSCQNIDELQKIFNSLKAKLKTAPTFLSTEQIQEIIKLKDEIKEKFETTVVEVPAETVEIEENKNPIISKEQEAILEQELQNIINE